jgi:glutathione reductase (NADPH)
MADNREFGGTCSNRGCNPKKVLMGPTEILESSKHLIDKGVMGKVELNWKKSQKFKRTFTETIPKRTEEKLNGLEIALYHQSPKFIDKNTLSVEGKRVKADKIVIATGYEPRVLPITEKEYLRTSDDFLNLKKLPNNITFIGAGYIGMEFAHMAVRYGAKVTVIDTNERPLSNFDDDLVSHLTEYSKKLGIKFIFNAKLIALKKLRKNIELTYKVGDKNMTLKSRAVFNTAGRIPAVKELELEKGGVSFNGNGIEVNEYLQNPGNASVYACGDVSANGVPLTPLSGREGHVVGTNIVEGNSKKIELPTIPSVVFTLPNLATVGLSEKEAKTRYKEIIVRTNAVPEWFNAKRLNNPNYAYKIILNARNQEILGAHILGPEASETINIFTIAINAKMTAGQLKETLFTYPSWANDVKSMV